MAKLRALAAGLFLTFCLFSGKVVAQSTCVMPTVGPHTMADVMTTLDACLATANIRALIASERIVIKAVGVNFNSANTDTTIPVTLPTGVSNYQIASVRIANASASISTATYGLFSAAAGGGTAIIPSPQAITVTTAGANTNNNSLTATPTNSGTQSWNFSNLFFRVVTAQGSAATADVIITLVPLP